jgi:DNA-binding beta-propeller fold protein YncE
MTLRRKLLGATVAVLVALGAASSASAAYQYAGRFGHEGQGPGEFGGGILGAGANRQYDDPGGIAAASDGTVLVVDPSNSRVERFKSSGAYVSSFGSRGHDKGWTRVALTTRFFQPEGIALDPAGHIYVIDTGNDRIMKFNSRGRFLKRLAKTGSFPGEVVQPWGGAIGGGKLFVADQGNYEIDTMTTSGGAKRSFGRFGRGPGEFVTPGGVAATPSGDRVYVADIIRHKVLMFDGSGKFLDEFGSPGVGPGQFLKPTGVTVGIDGSVFVSDRCNWRVERFTATGEFIESFGHENLASPTFLVQDRTGTLYVSDFHRVVKFSPSASAARRATATTSPRARAAHHNDIDIQCRHVAEMNGVRSDSRAPQR